MTEDDLKLTNTYRRLVKGTNINEETLLATDYLNHFNEVIMMIDMVPDMPECLEEAKEWAPKTYAEHFRDSTFSDKDLAVLAYENAPEKYRSAFDDVTNQFNEKIATGIGEIETVINGGADNEHLRHVVVTLAQDVQKLMDRSSAIINGDFDEAEAEAVTFDQDEIDKLFD